MEKKVSQKNGVIHGQVTEKIINGAVLHALKDARQEFDKGLEAVDAARRFGPDSREKVNDLLEKTLEKVPEVAYEQIVKRTETFERQAKRMFGEDVD